MHQLPNARDPGFDPAFLFTASLWGYDAVAPDELQQAGRVKLCALKIVKKFLELSTNAEAFLCSFSLY